MSKKNDISPSARKGSTRLSKHQLLGLLRLIFEARVFSTLDCL
jgi:hypothetical protein